MSLVNCGYLCNHTVNTYSCFSTVDVSQRTNNNCFYSIKIRKILNFKVNRDHYSDKVQEPAGVMISSPIGYHILADTKMHLA